MKWTSIVMYTVVLVCSLYTLTLYRRINQKYITVKRSQRAGIDAWQRRRFTCQDTSLEPGFRQACDNLEQNFLELTELDPWIHAADETWKQEYHETWEYMVGPILALAGAVLDACKRAVDSVRTTFSFFDSHMEVINKYANVTVPVLGTLVLVLLVAFVLVRLLVCCMRLPHVVLSHVATATIAAPPLPLPRPMSSLLPPSIESHQQQQQQQQLPSLQIEHLPEDVATSNSHIHEAWGYAPYASLAQQHSQQRVTSPIRQRTTVKPPTLVYKDDSYSASHLSRRNLVST